MANSVRGRWMASIRCDGMMVVMVKRSNGTAKCWFWLSTRNNAGYFIRLVGRSGRLVDDGRTSATTAFRPGLGWMCTVYCIGCAIELYLHVITVQSRDPQRHPSPRYSPPSCNRINQIFIIDSKCVAPRSIQTMLPIDQRTAILLMPRSEVNRNQ